MTQQGERLWQPDAARRDAAAITRFARARGLPDADALHAWAETHRDEFWDAVWSDLGVIGTRGAGPAWQPGATLRDDRYFPQARLSYAENLCAGGERPGARPVAVIVRGEDGTRRELTWQQLSTKVAACRRWLADHGVGPGAVVAAWLPNTEAALIAMLATNALGATFTSTSPDFGVAGVLDRFRQVRPTVLLAADGYRYAGRAHVRAGVLADVVDGLPSLRAVVVVRQLGLALPDLPVPVRSWQSVVSGGGRPVFTRTPLRTPGFVLYSSGTTGPPKCIVHSATGLLLKHLTEHQLHSDIRPGDTVLYFTTCGWMMWNWLVSALASGATIVLYDGSPFHPSPEALWDVAADEDVTLFGTSAKYLDACHKAGVAPRRSHALPDLRTIASTGSPLSAETFAYVYDDVAPDVHLASISGGTDLCGCFVIGDPTRPVFAGEIQGAALGCAVDVVDDTGATLPAGQRGELVCRSSFPSLPLGFAGDDDGSRYTQAYFTRFPGLWAHGDFAAWTEHGGLVIHGRSDATLNAGGVRIGTAEIYRQVEQLPQVAEALAIGQEWDDDTRIVLFVRPRDAELASGAQAAPPELVSAIADRLRRQCSPRHVPSRVVLVPDLPRTRSGKLAELAVADVVHGRVVRNSEALANPEALDWFRDVPALRA